MDELASNYDNFKRPKIENLGNGWRRMHYKSGEERGTIDCDCFMWATVRAAEVDNLNLDLTGVDLTERKH